jgi:Eco57I restriction-modification methylase
MTPPNLAQTITRPVLTPSVTRVLEPSFGVGGFLLPLIDHFIVRYPGTANASLGRVLTENVWGIELDEQTYVEAIDAITTRWGPLPTEHNLVLGDYFRAEPPFGGFDLVIGNPPFGGTFDAAIEDQLDRRFGRYQGDKLKKETYSFFIAKALGELAPDGALRFICSDTFLTIKTMKGLRRLLIDHGVCTVERLADFSHETNQPMVVLSVRRSGPSDHAVLFGSKVRRETMELTANHSWAISPDHATYFDGPTLGNFLVATGGMTIGRNEFFVREIVGNMIEERYEFSFFDDPVRVDREIALARLGKLSVRQIERLRADESCGVTRRNVRVTPRDTSVFVSWPHPDYKPYNKSSSARLYGPPSHAVYWKDSGDAVLTFKKNGPWYLRGVGGAPYFLREGLTWQLVAPRINARYLPAGYILDSGAPCAFLRPGIDPDELWFILGWLQTRLATQLLKGVINHTRNIQGKDVERLPYPHWVGNDDRATIIDLTRAMVNRMMVGEACASDEFGVTLEPLFERFRAEVLAAA